MKNLVLLDLHCSNVTDASDRCRARDSFVKYTCERGYVFDNKDGKLFF